MVDKVSIDKQFDFVSGEVSKLADGTEDGVKLFVPMYAAIWGGSVWLRLQMKGETVPTSYAFVSDVLVGLLTALCIFMTLYNLVAWWGYRQELCGMTSNTDHPVPLPHLKSAFIEFGLCTAMLFGCVIFCCKNPFVS
jgi:hypothetical protein